MFLDSEFNQDISRWNLGKVEMMFQMFSGSDFSQDLCAWENALGMDTLWSTCFSVLRHALHKFIRSLLKVVLFASNARRHRFHRHPLQRHPLRRHPLVVAHRTIT